MRTSDQTNLIFEALSKAQGSFKPIKKNKEAVIKGETKAGKPYEYKYNYADLSDILDSVIPSLSDNALFLTQGLVIEREVMLTRVTHASGQWIETEYPVVPKGQDMQGIGAGFTFARRYAINGILGISSEEDTDGEKDRPQEKSSFKTKEPEKKAVVNHAPIGVDRAIKLMEKIISPDRWDKSQIGIYCKSVLKKELQDLNETEATNFFALAKTKSFKELLHADDKPAN